MKTEDTISAIATALGTAGVGIILSLSLKKFLINR